MFSNNKNTRNDIQTNYKNVPPGTAMERKMTIVVFLNIFLSKISIKYTICVLRTVHSLHTRDLMSLLLHNLNHKNKSHNMTQSFHNSLVWKI